MDNSLVFRFTKDAMEKLKLKTQIKNITREKSALEWFVGVFSFQRRKYFLSTNAITLYSVISIGKGINNDYAYFDVIIGDMYEQMKKDGVLFFYQRYVNGKLNNSIITKTDNKAVLGSMNDFIFQAKMYLEYESVRDATSRINKSPMSYIGMNMPIDYTQSYTGL